MKNIKKRKRKRRWWVRLLIRERENLGCYETLFKTHRETDRKSFFRLFNIMASTLEDEEGEVTLDKSLECPICLYRFVDPKMLTCTHTFCERCIEPVVKENEIICPNCRYVTEVDHGSSSLASNWVLQRKIAELTLEESIEKGLVTCAECEEETSEYFCANCRLMLCSLCASHHKRVARYKNHQITAIKESNVTVADNTIPRTCEKHNEVLKYFCSTCDVTLCLDCTLSSAHKSHQFALLNEVIEAKIEHLKTVIESGKEFYEDIEKKLNTANRIVDDVSKAKLSSVEIVMTYFDSIIATIRDKKEELLDWLETGHRESEESINKVTKELIVLKNSLEYGSKLTEADNQDDIISAVLHTATKIQTMLDFSLHDQNSLLTSSTSQNDTENPFKILVKKREIQGKLSKVIVTDALKELIDVKPYVQREAPISSYIAFRPITSSWIPIMSTGITFGSATDITITTSTKSCEQADNTKDTVLSTASGGVLSVSTESEGATSVTTESEGVTSVSTESEGVTSATSASGSVKSVSTTSLGFTNEPTGFWGLNSVPTGFWGVTTISTGFWGINSVSTASGGVTHPTYASGGVTSVSAASWGVTPESSGSKTVPLSSSNTFAENAKNSIFKFPSVSSACIDSTSTKPITNACNTFGGATFTSAGNCSAILSPSNDSKATITSTQWKTTEIFGAALKDDSSFQFTFPTSANFSFTSSTNSIFTFAAPSNISNVTNSNKLRTRSSKKKTSPLTCIETLYQ